MCSENFKERSLTCSHNLRSRGYIHNSNLSFPEQENDIVTETENIIHQYKCSLIRKIVEMCSENFKERSLTCSHNLRSRGYIHNSNLSFPEQENDIVTETENIGRL